MNLPWKKSISWELQASVRMANCFTLIFFFLLLLWANIYVIWKHYKQKNWKGTGTHCKWYNKSKTQLCSIVTCFWLSISFFFLFLFNYFQNKVKDNTYLGWPCMWPRMHDCWHTHRKFICPYWFFTPFFFFKIDFSLYTSEYACLYGLSLFNKSIRIA